MEHVLSGFLLTLSSIGASYADAVTQTGSGPLPFAGYGYQYTATWESSASGVAFTPAVIGGVPNTFLFSGSFSSTSPPQSVTSFDFNATVQVRFINVSTGQEELPAGVLSQRTGFGKIESYVVSGFQAGGIRFSNYNYSLNSNLFGPGGGPVDTFAPIPTSAQYALSFRFEAGNFLNPSSDPSCASFACMVPGQDLLGVSNLGSFNIGAVPEPRIFALFLGGLALLAGSRRLSGMASRRVANSGPAGNAT
jgi:hypothetical protein